MYYIPLLLFIINGITCDEIKSPNNKIIDFIKLNYVRI